MRGKTTEAARGAKETTFPKRPCEVLSPIVGRVAPLIHESCSLLNPALESDCWLLSWNPLEANGVIGANRGTSRGYTQPHPLRPSRNAILSSSTSHP